MAARASHLPFARLRRALLVLLLATVGGLAVLYWFGRQGSESLEEPGGVAEHAGAVAGEALAVSEGFQFEQQVGGQPVFRIAGDRFRAAKEGAVELEGVRLELFRDGEPYRVASERALYEPATQGAELTGAVEVTGGDGFRLRTAALELSPGGRELVAPGAVEIGQGDSLSGSGSGLHLDFTVDRYRLEGPTRLRTTGQSTAEPGTDLSANEIVVERRRHQVTATGDVVLVRGGDRIECQQLALYFAPDDKTPRTLLAQWQVSGRLEASDEATESVAVEFLAEQVNLDFEGDPARPSRIALEARPGEQVRLFAPGAAGVVREMAARYLVGALAEGRMTQAYAFRPVYFAEYPQSAPDRPMRTGQADQVDAEFDARGRPMRLSFAGQVRFVDQRLEGSGERGFYDLERGRAELFGRSVRLKSDRGDLVAPHVAWDRSTGLTTAEGGVRANLDDRSAGLLAGAQSGGQGPVRVESEQAILSESPRGFLFRGRVQAWRGESVLFTDQLRGEEAGQRLSAGGGVKTVWLEPASPGAPAPPPTEISAETLAYGRLERSLVYTGSVRMKQAERVLTAQELTAELSELDQVRKLTAHREVRLEDTATGKTVEATTAIYDLEARSALFTGEPVKLRDPQGTIQGRRLLYDLDTGSARMLAEAP